MHTQTLGGIKSEGLPLMLWFFPCSYSDGDLTLIYPDGDKCSTGFQRMTIINFECNRNICESTFSLMAVNCSVVWHLYMVFNLNDVES